MTGPPIQFGDFSLEDSTTILSSSDLDPVVKLPSRSGPPLQFGSFSDAPLPHTAQPTFVSRTPNGHPYSFPQTSNFRPVPLMVFQSHPTTTPATGGAQMPAGPALKVRPMVRPPLVFSTHPEQPVEVHKANGVAAAAAAAAEPPTSQPNGVVEPLVEPVSQIQLDSRPEVPVGVPPKTPPKSWADLVKKSATTPNGSSPSSQNGSVATSPSSTPPAPQASHPSSNSNQPTDPISPAAYAKLAKQKQKTTAEIVSTFRPTFEPAYFQPRGMVNRGNMCFMHVILQPLLFSAPLYHLLRQLDPLALTLTKATPVLETMVHFVNEFVVIEESKVKIWKDSSEKDRFGKPFAPEFIYGALQKHRAGSYVMGRQEDAEEYLGFLLDSLHEEFLAVKRAGMKTEKHDSTSGTITDFGLNSPAGDDGDWVEIGPKNKTTITRDLQEEGKVSPISLIFGGRLRSVVKAQGLKASVTLQPFHSLQLDITPDDVHSIPDALLNLTKMETLDGFMNTKTKTEVEATKHITIESLPPILILHLKRFVFDNVGGSQKLHKFVEYPLILSLQDELFSHPEKVPQESRKYQLFAVAYHHGNTTTGGHYTCDVLHATKEWFRIDDTNVTRINNQKVTEEKPDRVAYLLFYKQVS